jgi:hypothetical protein
MIKRVMTATAVTMLSLGGLSTPAEAGFEISIGFGQIYVSGRASCGCPIHTRRVCQGYDRHRRPVFNYYRVPFQRGCKHARHPHGGPPGHAHRHHNPKPPKHSKSPKHHHGKKGKKH